MSTASSALEALALVALFVLLASWAYRFLFNHHLIRNYAHRTHFPKAQVNGLLQHAVAATHGAVLVPLDVDDEAAEEHRPRGAHAVPRPHARHADRIVGALFLAVVALACELVFLLMVELFGSAALRLAALRGVVAALVVLASIVQPPLVASLYMNQSLAPQVRLQSPASLAKAAATAALCAVWLLVLARFGALARGLGVAADRSFLDEKSNEVVLAGISISAFLSGVGCMLTPVRSFRRFRRFRTSTGASMGAVDAAGPLNEIIHTYNSTKLLRKKRQAQLDALLAAAGGTEYSAPRHDSLRLLKGSGRQLLSRVQSFTSLSGFAGVPSEEQELASEIASLQSLQDLVYADFSQHLDAFLRAQNTSANTGLGPARLVAWGDALFALYCVYRVVNVLFVRLPYHYFYSIPDLHGSANIIDDGDVSEALNQNTKDALAITIAKLIRTLWDLPLSETQLVNQVSFFLSGSLFVCSFQNVVVTFKSLGRFLPSHTTAVNAHVKTLLKHLIVSEFLAIYVIATALLIRSNLPTETAALMLKVLSLLSTSSPTSAEQMLREVEFIDTWFDKVFGASCVVTLLVLAMKVFIESDTVHEGCDEEMMLENDSRLKLS